MNHIERLLLKYPNDQDILKLLSEKSNLHKRIQTLETKLQSLSGQLTGLIEFIKSKELLKDLE